MAIGFSSDKMRLVIGDGFEFLRNNQNQYDVIITDSSGNFKRIIKITKTCKLIKNRPRRSSAKSI